MVIIGNLPTVEDIAKMEEQQINQLIMEVMQSQSKVINVSMPLFQLLNIYLFVCTIFAFTRRLHDLNKSGFYYLWLFVPIVGLFFFIWLLCAKGVQGPNAYGPDPLEHQSSGSASHQA